MDTKEMSPEITSSQDVRGPTKKEDWCLIWDQTKITRVGGNWELGFKNYTKMMLFLKSNDFSIEDFDYYKNLSIGREPQETYEYYKLRQNFQNALIKYRNAVKGIIFYKAMAKAMEKLQKEQEDKKSEENKKLQGTTVGTEPRINI